jgi:(p)ppGpp synthase/HD superfamily hydrolase
VYSDRIHHAFAFAATHYPEPISRYDGESGLIRASSVAVILARYGAEESTIVASILKHLFDACPPDRQLSLGQELLRKFGPMVALAIDGASEPRYDVLSRERTWKACRFAYLAKLATAGPAAVDVCVAEELHRIGASLVAIRRLGIEYLEQGGEPSAEDTRWWLDGFGDMLRVHPAWRRPEMLSEFQRQARELAERLADSGG